MRRKNEGKTLVGCWVKFISLLFVVALLLCAGMLLIWAGKYNKTCRDIFVGLGTGVITSAFVSLCFALVDLITVQENGFHLEINIYNVSLKGTWYIAQIKSIQTLIRKSIQQNISGRGHTVSNTMSFLRGDALSYTSDKCRIFRYFYMLTENATTQMLNYYEKCKYIMNKKYREVCKEFIGSARRLKAFYYTWDEENFDNALLDFENATKEVLKRFGFPEEIITLPDAGKIESARKRKPMSAEEYVKLAIKHTPALAVCLQEKDFVTFTNEQRPQEWVNEDDYRN